MTGRKQTRGECVFCGRAMTKSGMATHLKSCPQRQEANQAAASKKPKPATELLYHLQVQKEIDPKTPL